MAGEPEPPEHPLVAFGWPALEPRGGKEASRDIGIHLRRPLRKNESIVPVDYLRFDRAGCGIETMNNLGCGGLQPLVLDAAGQTNFGLRTRRRLSTVDR